MQNVAGDIGGQVTGQEQERVCQVLGLAHTAQGDEFFLYLEITQHAATDFRAKLLVYEMTDDLWEIYQDGIEAQKTRV